MASNRTPQFRYSRVSYHQASQRKVASSSKNLRPSLPLPTRAAHRGGHLEHYLELVLKVLPGKVFNEVPTLPDFKRYRQAIWQNGLRRVYKKVSLDGSLAGSWDAKELKSINPRGAPRE